MSDQGPFDVVVITGLSGSGMTEVTKAFEDIGYLVIDNLPPSVIEQVADLCRKSGMSRAAVVVRPSGREFFQEFFQDLGGALSGVKEKGAQVRIVFLEASDEALVRRYEEQRRPHPLAPNERIQDGIDRERQLMEVLKADADIVIDTSALTPHQLRQRIVSSFRAAAMAELQVSVVTFGYKHGLPIDADLVFDTRFLPNPHWVDELRPLTGTDEAIRTYVLGNAEAKAYLARIEDLLESTLPAFRREGKHYLTVAIGCTGGRHRSVVFGEEISKFLDEIGYPAVAQHRDLERR
jgi:RNase adapter protein RapZ